MAERDAGKSLELQILHGRALGFCKGADLDLRERDVPAELLADRRRRLVDRRRVDAEAFRAPAVELARVAADLPLGVGVDPGQHFRNGGADFVRDHRALPGSLLQVLDGHPR